jgi:hypothetical protein
MTISAKGCVGRDIAVLARSIEMDGGIQIVPIGIGTLDQRDLPGPSANA